MNPRFPDAPPQIRALPLDPRGYPIPWFVGVNPTTGERDFRVIHADQVAVAVKCRKCWICGRNLGEFATFVIGPMCAINRVSAEPPSHLDCARFAVRACPFLTNPQARRDPRGMDAAKAEAATPGLMLEHNPGVALLWRTRRWRMTRAGLFDLGQPVDVGWFAHGRPATADEVRAAILKGLPALVDACALDPDPAASRATLDKALAKALDLIPA